jgi:uncharacterized protein YqeY
VNADEIQERLRVALRAAMKSRDTVATSALRSALAAIANAEAVPPEPTTGPSALAGHAHVAGSVAGLRAAEAERRALTGDDVAAIVAAEAADRRGAAAQYEASGNAGRAARLRHEAEVIESAVDLR